MQILRKIHTPTHTNGYYRIKVNQEICNKLQYPNTVYIIDPSALSYFNSCSYWAVG
jgi:hypothetical protein